MKVQTIRGRLLASTLLAGVVSLGVPAAVLIGAASLPTMASAQDLTSGVLAGHVTSDSGAPIAGATVVVTSNDRGTKQTLTTDSSGNFRASQIPIGGYTVAVTANGFQGFTDNNVNVALGSVSNYDFPLKAAGGTVSELVVTGKARRPSVDFDRVTTGVVVDVQATAARLPVARDIQGIVGLAPQITINEAFTALTPQNPNGLASISGSSPAENIYYINGMNVTNFRNFLGGSTIPFDFYDQVEVKTGGYSAEFGRSTGGAIIAVSRSGSNTFHGGINGYWEPQQLKSTTPSAPTSSTKSGSLYDNSYALGLQNKNKSYEGNIWLSGPLWKDHLFFFGFYNPRHFEDVTGTASSTDSTPNAFTNGRPGVYDVITRKNPFYGGKLDFDIIDGQRLEYTYFRDNQNSIDTNYVASGTGYTTSNTNNYSGGKNEILKYTGKFTSWFTLSALYGETAFNQSSIGDLDANPSIVDPGGNIIGGNPNLTIASGADTRKNTRIDADIYAKFMGDHHFKIGYDKEDLHSSQSQSYSGGIYYRYYATGTNCGSTGTISTATLGCVRVRKLNNIGSYSIEQKGWYVQDAWDVNDRLSLQVGVRGEDFNNKNAAGTSFIHTTNQVAPRLGLTYDVFGDKTTKLKAFYGRYYLPIAANTNIRGSGGEIFLQDFYTYTRNASDPTPSAPTLVTKLSHTCLEGLDNGTACLPDIPDPSVLASTNLKPQYQDEFIIGVERSFDFGWTFGANAIYRDLKSVLEDANLDSYEPQPGRNAYCVYANISAANCGSFGNSGYVIINPGSDVRVKLNSTWGGGLAGTYVTIPASVLTFPKAKRTYAALELTAKRPFDGKWSLDASYVLSKSQGNYEGGVKSDNGQADTGATQDFDEPGWMNGSDGLLPNHHAHQFKAYGTYQLTENLLMGFNAQLISPRHYGCIGYYPLNDGRADQTTLTAWYCNALSPTALAAGQGYATPRGSQFKGDWVKKVDLSFVYTVPTEMMGKLQVRADVFNVFNTHDAVINNEFGETGGIGTRQYAYGTPAVYQKPRFIRFGLNYEF